MRSMVEGYFSSRTPPPPSAVISCFQIAPGNLKIVSGGHDLAADPHEPVGRKSSSRLLRPGHLRKGFCPEVGPAGLRLLRDRVGLAHFGEAFLVLVGLELVHR